MMLTIFLVEDDEELRDFLESLLGADYCVVPFASGQSALKALHTLSPDALLCDVELRDMAGEDIAQEVRQSHSHTRVVLMSGNHSRLERARPLADRVVRKPFSIGELVGALQSLEA